MSLTKEAAVWSWSEKQCVERLQLEFAGLIESLQCTGVCQWTLIGQPLAHASPEAMLEILVEGGTLRLTVFHDPVAAAVAAIHESRQRYRRGTTSLDGLCGAISFQLGQLAQLRYHSDDDEVVSLTRELKAVEQFESFFDQAVDPESAPTSLLRERMCLMAAQLADAVMPISVAVRRDSIHARLDGILRKMNLRGCLHQLSSRFVQTSVAKQVTTKELAAIPEADAYMIGCLRSAMCDWMDSHGTIEDVIRRAHQYASLLQSVSETWWQTHYADIQRLNQLVEPSDLKFTRAEYQALRMTRTVERIDKIIQRRIAALDHVSTRWWWRSS